MSLPAGLVCGVGCAGEPRAVVHSIAEPPDAARHPDGVVLDTPAALPTPSSHADAHGVVALREPMGMEGVDETVIALVSAVQAEDLATFESLLLPECAVIDGAATVVRSSRAFVLERFRHRIADLDFSRLAGLELVRSDRLERAAFDELAPQRRPSIMRAGDVLVRAPIEVSRVGGDKYFGDTWLLVLRRAEGAIKFRVAAFGEIDAAP